MITGLVRNQEKGCLCVASCLHAGLPVDQWVTGLFWYCADGAEVMQSTGNGVAGLLMKLQADVLGYSVVVPVHAKCHGADLTVRNAMDSSHRFVDLVADMMGLWRHGSRMLQPICAIYAAWPQLLCHFAALQGHGLHL